MSFLIIYLFPILIDYVSQNSEATYTILPESTLAIFGTSNINEFKCECKKSWGSYPISFETNEDATCLYFEEVGLSIPVESLDCRHPQITKDLAKALKADHHPYIHFRVLEAIHKDQYEDLPIGQCISTIIHVEIEIGGVVNLVNLEVDCYFLENNMYHFSAFQELNMCDFEIEPPTAMLGLIQVNPIILIDIDLRVRLHYS
ncbi:MAG: hypothetical protein R3275_06585 [Saprospiraceae bacterium]|nr:hypothetical protein [Saprospiraceae bacterium]